ncbi:MAG: glycerol-3-phosphate dehydrogenase/oxidase [Anaerolineae bacterium]|nr:glycerol-3-phosphate dehydrogenase/oxidase [Anaerolineae bacterium]
MKRHDIIQAMREKPDIPVLIIGGGINGAGLYRELALQGVAACLVDKGDFMSGASAASSHMIHGGLRYLENGEFRLVKESLAERNRLLKNAPHYVQPLPTTIPLFNWSSGLIAAGFNFLGRRSKPSNRGALLIKAGLSMYDFYTRKQSVMPEHSFTSRHKSLAARPLLNKKIVCTATYYDAWISYPERLGLELILDAETAHPNCKAINYMRADRANGHTVYLTDTLSGEHLSIQPQIVVNATGAWIDFTNAALTRDTQLIGGTKGSHLIIDNDELLTALKGQMIYFENADGRVCIMFPYQGRVLAGSTDIHIKNPDEAICTPEEMAYILESIRNVFPEVRLSEQDVVFRYCGVRPLPHSKASTTGQISRDHNCEIIPATGVIKFPIYALIGGKWTTFRAFSEQVADKVLAQLGIQRQTDTYDIPIGGGLNYPVTDPDRQAWIKTRQADGNLDQTRIETLLNRYGTRSAAFIEYLQAQQDTPLEHNADYSRREIEFIATYERVSRLSDLVLRRTSLAMIGNITIPLLQELAGIIVPILDWSDDEMQVEIDRTIQLLKQHYGMKLKTEERERN